MKPKRILVVDDSELILGAVAQALRGAGYTVTATSDLAELMSKSEHEAFDLMLMDVEMPELYGDDIAAVLRHSRGVGGRMYLFSSLPNDDLAARVKDAELDGYISKNDGLEAMIVKVAEILS